MKAHPVGAKQAKRSFCENKEASSTSLDFIALALARAQKSAS